MISFGKIYSINFEILNMDEERNFVEEMIIVEEYEEMISVEEYEEIFDIFSKY